MAKNKDQEWEYISYLNLMTDFLISDRVVPSVPMIHPAAAKWVPQHDESKDDVHHRCHTSYDLHPQTGPQLEHREVALTVTEMFSTFLWQRQISSLHISSEVTIFEAIKLSVGSKLELMVMSAWKGEERMASCLNSELKVSLQSVPSAAASRPIFLVLLSLQQFCTEMLLLNTQLQQECSSIRHQGCPFQKKAPIERTRLLEESDPVVRFRLWK